MRNFFETWVPLFHFPSNFKISVKSRIASYSWAFGGKFDTVVVCFPKNQWACVWKWTPVLALRYPFAEVSPNHFKHYDDYTHSRRWCRRFITELQNLGQCRHFTTVIPLMFIAYLFFSFGAGHNFLTVIHWVEFVSIQLLERHWRVIQMWNQSIGI